MTNTNTSLWSYVSTMSLERFNGLYEEFPHTLRCLLGEWLETEPWEFINRSDSFCTLLAGRLLSAMVEKIRDLANKNCNSAAQILQFVANIESRYRKDPLQLANVIKRILEAEQRAVQQQHQHVPLVIERQREELMFRFSLEKLHYRLQEIQTLRESFQQMKGNARAPLSQNSLDCQFPIQDNLPASSFQSLQGLFMKMDSELEEAKKKVLVRLLIWKRQQQLAGNGSPFDEDLSPLQKRLECLVDIWFQFRQQLITSGIELQSRVREHLDETFKSLVQNSFLVEKQPPQVLKTQTKFQASVRFLLGPHLLKHPPTSFLVTADIVTEKQARELTANHSPSVFSESTGEIVNNTASLDINASSNSCTSQFKNLLLKKIKRCDRKSTESVTEEKCAVLFSANVCLGPNQTNFHLQALSLPVVVIVHGNQDNNAKATILWDNAFAAPDRVPFVVAERVSWKAMCDTLNQKFLAEVQTTKGLLKDHYFFLAQKIFGDNITSLEELQRCHVSWSQFNKEMLPGRGFTFWQWFEGILDLTKKYLKNYWSDRLIMGFVSKQYVFNYLSNAPAGTFLLRFSDSEIGGISIAYVNYFPDGSTQVENIQPFTAKQLSIRSLADCVLDLPQLHVLYPNRPKHEAFRRDYNTETRKNTSSYVPARLTITVDTPCSFPTSIQKPLDTLGGSNVNLAVHSDSTYHDPPVIVPSPIGTSVASNTTYGSSQLPFELMTCSYPLGNASPLGSVDSYTMCQDVEMPDLSIPTENTVTYPGNLPLHLMADSLSVPETISPPSSEEFEKLLHPDQDLHPDLHFCHNPV
ncbi:signal transducer and activator of transcription 6 [Crotalus tigris]|uniref:signal transducer and activator of transcription 6 n=1 Tax=Crotalus tigris TaxID=88082 RepID=UPI00192F7A76|nr:signal transducer and activator of transcription 6 [Crotalus tigris]XP_039221642.1 signal transducer and activator of transcription 6 [Crotalus tigris]XP_039221643.1 signal transducer and activator of transcription 6 [Crotalus tigris]